MIGYLIGADVMATGGLVELIFGVAAERKPLEDIAAPLTLIHKASETITGKLTPPGPARGIHPAH